MLEEYTNKELAHLITDMRQESRQDLGEIKEQVKRTNGRVSAIENREQFTRGVLWAIGVALTFVIIPISLFLIYQYLSQ